MIIVGPRRHLAAADAIARQMEEDGDGEANVYPMWPNP
jgi:hypothetical protein